MLVSLLALPLLVGCVRKPRPPGRYVVTEVDILGTSAVDSDDVQGALATAPSETPLGIPGLEGIVFDYSVYDENVLSRDVERVERYYHARGYYQAKVTAVRVERDEASRNVRITIRVHEGEPVRTISVTPSGLQDVTPATAFRAQRAIVLSEGRPFDEFEYERSKQGIEEALGDGGYAFAVVHGKAEVDVARREARVTFEVIPGPLSRYGPVTIQGLKEVPESVVRRTLQIEPGATYSRADLVEAEDALVNLGVFADVNVEPDKTHPESAVVPITVRIREGALRTVQAGIGVRIDPLQLGSTLRIGWEDRNLLGGLRRLSIDERPGIALFPTRTSLIRAPTRLLPSNHFRAALRQPSFLEGRTAGSLAAEYNIYPLLFPLPAGKSPQLERILGYHEIKGTIGLDRPFFDLRLFVAPSYTYQANIPLAYQAPPGEAALPNGLDTVIVAYPELVTTFDLRDDRISPTRGALLSSSFQAPSRIFGSDVSDLRWRPEIRTYLPVSKQAVLATRLTFGFLLPRNYGETLGDPARVASNPTDPAVIRDQHRLLFRAFYSGGPNSNRGYAFSEVGPHGPLGLLSNGPVNCLLTPNDPDCIRPLGGLTLWEASTEVRFRILGPLRGVVFADASDVTRKRWYLRLTVPHLSPGIGIRYDTPVGPLRVDLGYRLLERTSGAPPPGPIRDEAQTRGWFGASWLPMTLNIALGEAY